MFSCAWHWLHVFPHLALVSCFHALGTGCMLSRTWHWLHVFPGLALVTCFPTLGTGDMVSCARYWLHVFLCLAPVTCFLRFFAPVTVCFPVLGTECMSLRSFPLAPVACFYFKFWLTHGINYACCGLTRCNDTDISFTIVNRYSWVWD